MSAKGEYLSLLRMGELLEIYPELTGFWVDDQKEFTKMYEANNKAFRELNLEYENIGDDEDQPE